MEYTYKGFSTKQYQHDKNFIMTDVELVKEDLVNHIFTRRGERIKMGQFGTKIPDLVFEPLTEELSQIVYNELEYVFNYDPRVELIDMVVVPDIEKAEIVAFVDLNYIELREKDRLTLRIEFET